MQKEKTCKKRSTRISHDNRPVFWSLFLNNSAKKIADLIQEIDIRANSFQRGIEHFRNLPIELSPSIPPCFQPDLQSDASTMSKR